MLPSEPLGLRRMSLDRQQAPRWPEPLAGRLVADAGIDQVVDAIMSLWREMDIALAPIIGHRGVAALFNRSLQIVSNTHPWLAVARGSALDAVDPSALKAALLQQPAAAAAAAGAACFQTVRDLLASLIGAHLTDRLLHPAWSPSRGSAPAQDLSP